MTSPIDEVVSILTEPDGIGTRMSLWRAIGTLVAAGHTPLVRRSQADTTARDSTGADVEVARAVARACAFPGTLYSMEANVSPGWFASAFWDVPWCASRAAVGAPSPWTAYHRHLLRAVRRLQRAEAGP